MTETVSNDVSVDASFLNHFVRSNASSGKSTTLEFITAELGKEIDLLLMFEPPKVGKLYVDLFPLCWKVISFSAIGISAATVEFTADTGFFAPQFQVGNRVSASNAQHCKVSQKCTLKVNENGNGNYLTQAVAAVPVAMQCFNATERIADLGLGFFNDAGNKIEPTAVWQNIAKGSTLSVQHVPKLRIYAVSNFKATEVIKGDIESQLLFERILTDLPPYTEWNVSIDEGTGEVKIERL